MGFNSGFKGLTISDHLTFPSSEGGKQAYLLSVKHHTSFDMQNGEDTKEQTRE